jgi:hypothetical protein
MGDNNKRTIHYDKTLKNLFNISDRLTIYAINAFFKKDFKEDTKIQQLNREYIKLDKTTAIADTVLNIEKVKEKTAIPRNSSEKWLDGLWAVGIKSRLSQMLVALQRLPINTQNKAKTGVYTRF